MTPPTSPSSTSHPDKKAWERPAIVLEYSLVARAQGPVLGEDAFQKVENDPFLGPMTVSD